MPEACIIVLTNVTPIKKKRTKRKKDHGVAFKDSGPQMAVGTLPCDLPVTARAHKAALWQSLHRLGEDAPLREDELENAPSCVLTHL